MIIQPTLKSDAEKLDLDESKRTLNILKRALNILKSKVDKLDVDKLRPVPVDFKKINDVVKKKVVFEKTKYNELNIIVTDLPTIVS